MHSIDHEHIVRLYGVVLHNEALMLVKTIYSEQKELKTVISIGTMLFGTFLWDAQQEATVSLCVEQSLVEFLTKRVLKFYELSPLFCR